MKLSMYINVTILLDFTTLIDISSSVTYQTIANPKSLLELFLGSLFFYGATALISCFDPLFLKSQTSAMGM